MSKEMQHTCEHCGKVDSGPETYWPNASTRRYEALPAGWYQGKYDGADGWEDTQPVCSLMCAQSLEAKREAKTEARNAEYRRRKETGELTLVEVWSDRMAERLMNDYVTYVKPYEGLSGETAHEAASEPAQWESLATASKK